MVYEQLSVKVINYYLREEDIPKLNENKYVMIEGSTLRVFKLSIYGKDCYIAVDVNHGDIITFGLGKQRKLELEPIIHSIFIDRISYSLYHEFLAILYSTLEKMKIELLNNMSSSEGINFEEKSIIDIKNESQDLTNLFNILKNQVQSLINGTRSANRDLMLYTLREKRQSLQRIFGGAISKEILSILPIDLIQTTNMSMDDLERSNNIFIKFMDSIKLNYIRAIEAKEQGDIQSLRNIGKDMKHNAIKYLNDIDSIIRIRPILPDYSNKEVNLQ